MCGWKNMWKLVVEIMWFQATNEKALKDFMYILLISFYPYFILVI